MADKPEKIELYFYNVYFGDCFLLIFKYAGNIQKSVLIDFGTMGKGKDAEKTENNKDTQGERLLKVAEDIKVKCGGKLDVVVATHRHKDHIYGFGLKESGKIIMDCKPELVIQPWTENPEDNRDFTKKTLVTHNEFKADAVKHFTSMLDDMHLVAESIETEINHLGNENKFTKTINKKLKDRIIFAAEDNKIKNQAAVENLEKMSDNPHYVHFGYDKIDWETILPGVKVHILGPPTIDDNPEMTSASHSSEEMWKLRAMNKNFWGVQAATSRLTKSHIDDETLLFPKEKVLDDSYIPSNVRWFIRQLRSLRANQLLEIVKFVDNAINNTSVILLIETGDQKLLFPGDAEIENWKVVLGKAKNNEQLRSLLTDTTVYKVGHHGSRNANPKSLWENFKNKSTDNKKSGRLKTIVSTMKGKYGESEETAVPLPKMVKEMKEKSDFFSTEEISKGFIKMVEIDIN